jgi:hypothetical protein
MSPMFRTEFVPMRNWPYGRYRYFYNNIEVFYDHNDSLAPVSSCDDLLRAGNIQQTATVDYQLHRFGPVVSDIGTVESVRVENIEGPMTYEEHHAALEKYLLSKFHMKDWHGVRDAAVDIEVLEAKENARIVCETEKAKT